MDELILAALQGTITPADAARLDAWRRASPRNEAYYRDLARVWTLTTGEDPLVARVPAAPTGDLFREPRSVESIGRPVPNAPSRRARTAWVVAGAAAIGVAAAAVVLIVADFRGKLRGPAEPPAMVAGPSASEFVTDTSEMVTARLDDGSVVRLAPESRLRVLPDVRRREVWLDGHAFFAIAHDSAHPFKIRTRAGDVEVLGTRFDLRVVGSDLHLVVTDGKVALTTGTERRIVVAGQTASVLGDRPVVEQTVRADTLLKWLGGFLAFQDTPLRQVARELEQRYAIRVLLPDSALATRTVTAWFTGQDLNRILDAICQAVDAHCTLRDGVASIEP